MNRLNDQETRQLAQLICKKVALDLDDGDRSSIDQVANVLIDLPLFEAELAIAIQIGIERIVYHDLHCEGVFAKFLEDGNKFFSDDIDMFKKFEETKAQLRDELKDTVSLTLPKMAPQVPVRSEKECLQDTIDFLKTAFTVGLRQDVADVISALQKRLDNL